MKLRFKHQKFQADAAKAVVDVFAGQPYLTHSYMMDRGSGMYQQQSMTDDEDFTGWSNAKIVPELNERLILENIQILLPNPSHNSIHSECFLSFHTHSHQAFS